MNRDERFDIDGPPTDAECAAADRWAETIDAAVRGELDADALQRLEREAARDPWLADALADARAVRAVKMPSFEAPAALDAKILRSIDSHPPRRAKTVAPRPALRWIATAAVAAAIALMVVLPASSPEPATFVAADGTVFTADEVQAALDEVEMAMAVLGGELDRTSSIVRREMNTELHDHVAEPVQRGFGRTVDSIPYLREDAQDDQHSGVRLPPTGERPLRSLALPGAFSAERT